MQPPVSAMLCRTQTRPPALTIQRAWVSGGCRPRAQELTPARRRAAATTCPRAGFGGYPGCAATAGRWRCRSRRWPSQPAPCARPQCQTGAAERRHRGRRARRGTHVCARASSCRCCSSASRLLKAASLCRRRVYSTQPTTLISRCARFCARSRLRPCTRGPQRRRSAARARTQPARRLPAADCQERRASSGAFAAGTLLARSCSDSGGTACSRRTSDWPRTAGAPQSRGPQLQRSRWSGQHRRRCWRGRARRREGPSGRGRLPPGQRRQRPGGWAGVAGLAGQAAEQVLPARHSPDQAARGGSRQPGWHHGGQPQAGCTRRCDPVGCGLCYTQQVKDLA